MFFEDFLHRLRLSEFLSLAKIPHLGDHSTRVDPAAAFLASARSVLIMKPLFLNYLQNVNLLANNPVKIVSKNTLDYS